MINQEVLINAFLTGSSVKYDGRFRCIKSIERIGNYEFLVKFSDGHKAFIKTYRYDRAEKDRLAVPVS